MGLIKRTLFMLNETASKTVHKSSDKVRIKEVLTSPKPLGQYMSNSIILN